MLSELHCAERDSEKSVGTFGISKQMGSMSIASMSFFRDDDVSENVERGWEVCRGVWETLAESRKRIYDTAWSLKRWLKVHEEIWEARYALSVSSLEKKKNKELWCESDAKDVIKVVLENNLLCSNIVWTSTGWACDEDGRRLQELRRQVSWLSCVGCNQSRLSCS